MGASRHNAKFLSILFPEGEEPEAVEPPPFFRDLNFDLIVSAVAGKRSEYELAPFFAAPLRSVADVQYRHAVFGDLEREEVRHPVSEFAESLLRVRRFVALAQKLNYGVQQQHWRLDAAVGYVDAIFAVRDALDDLDLASEGLIELRLFLAEYASSAEFVQLADQAQTVARDLDRVRYAIRIKENHISVRPYEDETDYMVEIEQTFERFRQGDVENHLAIPADSGSMDHVEAQIAERVVRLYPEEFAALGAFSQRWQDFIHPVVTRFEREVQFYLGWLQEVEELDKFGLEFCYPEVSDESKETGAEGIFDLALATKVAAKGIEVVRNEFDLSGAERILVVSGPNQGGKSTFARAFGQLHQLARLGAPVPARSARLFLADEIYTHFEREEDVTTLRGKLDDELERMKEILEQATGDSVVILNEIFSATTHADAIILGSDVLSRLSELDCLGVCVTFVDELSSLHESTVSMVATVDPDDPSTRTFQIVRRAADGRAYAWALADKYGLSYERLQERLSR
jgi:DNA mismatch repair protein MutS